MKPQLKRSSRKAKAFYPGDEAWWYEDAKSIGVYVRGADGDMHVVRIKRRALASWLKRTS